MRPGPSDEQLLRMLREVEDVEESVHVALDEAVEEEAVPGDDEALDPCKYCGEPAQYFGECAVCDEPGCLPRDLWSPGMQDPCLTLCVRCAREIHLGCSAEDEAGNPRCPTCRI